jgi:hypothetical protein
MQPLLRTPMLCLRPSSEPEPTDFIFLKTLEIPQRDASGRGWHVISKLRTHAHTEELRLQIIRLYPTTSQTSDLQLDDAVAAIQEFVQEREAQALAKEAATKAGQNGLHRTHYFAVPDDVYFYQCEDLAADPLPAQGYGYGLASNVSSLPSVSPQSAEERSETYSSEDDEAEDSSVAEGVVSRLSLRDWRMLASAWYRLESA